MCYILLQYLLVIFMSPWLTVSLQITGVIGGSVVLPCSSTEDDLKLQDRNVFWRHNHTAIVCDIINGTDSVEKQDQQYKNRVETFPDDYLRGNFSIKLSKLQHTDAGEFSCFIISDSSDSIQETIQLIINESIAEKGNKPTDQKNQTEAEADGVVTRHFIIPAVICSIIFIITVCIIALILKNKKRSYSSHIERTVRTNIDIQ